MVQGRPNAPVNPVCNPVGGMDRHLAPPPATAHRASDAERERTVEILREHHLAGRLTSEEFEDRADDAWHARFVPELWHALRELPVGRAAIPPARPRAQRAPTPSSSAILALVLGLVAACLLVFTAGIASPLALPAAIGAWVVGRGARRAAAHEGPERNSRGVALTGEVLGAVCTAVIVLFAVVIAAAISGF